MTKMRIMQDDTEWSHQGSGQGPASPIPDTRPLQFMERLQPVAAPVQVREPRVEGVEVNRKETEPSITSPRIS